MRAYGMFDGRCLDDLVEIELGDVELFLFPNAKEDALYIVKH